MSKEKLEKYILLILAMLFGCAWGIALVQFIIQPQWGFVPIIIFYPLWLHWKRDEINNLT